MILPADDDEEDEDTDDVISPPVPASDEDPLASSDLDLPLINF